MIFVVQTGMGVSILQSVTMMCVDDCLPKQDTARVKILKIREGNRKSFKFSPRQRPFSHHCDDRGCEQSRHPQMSWAEEEKVRAAFQCFLGDVTFGAFVGLFSASRG